METQHIEVELKRSTGESITIKLVFMGGILPYGVKGVPGAEGVDRFTTEKEAMGEMAYHINELIHFDRVSLISIKGPELEKLIFKDLWAEDLQQRENHFKNKCVVYLRPKDIINYFTIMKEAAL